MPNNMHLQAAVSIICALLSTHEAGAGDVPTYTVVPSSLSHGSFAGTPQLSNQGKFVTSGVQARLYSLTPQLTITDGPIPQDQTLFNQLFTGIDDQGYVVGIRTFRVCQNKQTRSAGCVRAPGGAFSYFTNPQTGDWSYAFAVSESGRIGGVFLAVLDPQNTCWIQPSIANMFLSQTTAPAMGPLTLPNFFVGGIPGNNRINDDGVVISPANLQPTMWRNGTVVNIAGVAPMQMSQTRDLNDNRQIIGVSADPTGRGRLWTDADQDYTVDAGEMVDIGALPGATVVDPKAINDVGEIVGHCTINKVTVPFYRRDNVMIPLNGLLDPVTGSGYAVTSVIDINDNGLILAEATQNGVGRVVMLVPLPPADSDGDGLLDDWEINGIPYTTVAGNPDRYVLPGSNPQKKNLYLEVDAMSGFAPPNLDAVVQAFANAPVSNPDGSQGIILRIDDAETNMPHTGMLVVPNGQSFPPSALTLRTMHFGTPTERTDVDAVPMLDAKAKAYRYALLVDEITSDVLGVAEDLPGRNFVVCKGEFTVGTGSGDLCASCDIQTWIRTTFMHEFGHTLGLRHGGSDHVLYKPNYLSIMNYLYKVPFNLSRNVWKLDFSAGTMSAFNEQSVNENLPFSDPTGRNTGRSTYYAKVPCIAPPDPVCNPVPIQFNAPVHGYRVGAGAADLNGDQQLGASVCVDVNYFGSASPYPGANNSSPCQPAFSDFNDWAAIQYAVPPASSPLAGGPDPGLVELSKSAIKQLLALMPADCVADIAPGVGDGQVNIDDLVAVITSWGPCQAKGPCPGDISPLHVADHTVNIDDLVAVITAWGACP